MENCKLVDTPMAFRAIEVMIPFKGKATHIEFKDYGLKIGSLMYLAV